MRVCLLAFFSEIQGRIFIRNSVGKGHDRSAAKENLSKKDGTDKSILYTKI